MSNKSKVISMNKRVKAETQDSKNERIARLLDRSVKENYYITEKISGVEVLPSVDDPIAIVYMEDFKIIIPASECVTIDKKIDNLRPISEQYRFLLERRIGAEIDFLVTELDVENKVALASRKAAMNKRIVEQLFQVDPETNNFIVSEGTILEARVVATFRGSVVVEAFGVEMNIPIKELSYARMSNASDEFNVGDWLLVKVLHIHRDIENSVVEIKASVKQASPHPFDGNTLSENNRYVGEIAYIEMPEGKKPRVYVTLTDGNTALCLPPERGDMMGAGMKVQVLITTIVEDEKRIFGRIVQMESIL